MVAGAVEVMDGLRFTGKVLRNHRMERASMGMMGGAVGMVNVRMDVDQREHDHPSDDPRKENTGEGKSPRHIFSQRDD